MESRTPVVHDRPTGEVVTRLAAFASSRPALAAFLAGVLVASLWVLSLTALLGRSFELAYFARAESLDEQSRALLDGVGPPLRDGALWQILIVPGAEVGGALALAWPTVLGVVLVGLTASFVRSAAARTAGAVAGWTAVVLLLVNGWFLALALGGTEVALAGCALAGCAAGLAGRRATLFAAAAVAAILTVPWAVAALFAAVMAAVYGGKRRSMLATAGVLSASLALLAVLGYGAAGRVLEPDETYGSEVAGWALAVAEPLGALVLSSDLELVPLLGAVAALAGVILFLRRAPGVAGLVAATVVVAALAAGTTPDWRTDDLRLVAPAGPLFALAIALALAAVREPTRKLGTYAYVALAGISLPLWWGAAALGATALAGWHPQ